MVEWFHNKTALRAVFLVNKIVTMKIVHLCLVCVTCEHRPLFSVSFLLLSIPSVQPLFMRVDQLNILGTKKKKRIRFKWWKCNGSPKPCQGNLSRRSPQGVMSRKCPFVLTKQHFYCIFRSSNFGSPNRRRDAFIHNSDNHSSVCM